MTPPSSRAPPFPPGLTSQAGSAAAGTTSCDAASGLLEWISESQAAQRCTSSLVQKTVQAALQHRPHTETRVCLEATWFWL